MRRSIDQSVDNATESEQALVDHTSLLGTLVHCTGATNVLGTSQIDQIQLAYAK